MHLMWLLIFLLPHPYASFKHNYHINDVEDRFTYGLKELAKSGGGQCSSKERKSPINIEIGKTTIVSLPSLVFKDYNVSEHVTEGLPSNFTVSVRGYNNWTAKPMLSGGPLNGEYHLMEVQWDAMDITHYGHHDFNRKMYPYAHTVNNEKQDLEVHFIHTKGGISIEDALQIPGGVAIVAVFINHMDDAPFVVSSPIQPILSHQPGLKFKWRTPLTFFPEVLDSYYTYKGTFSYPPCTGDVTWIIFANPKLMTQPDVLTLMYTNSTKHSLAHFPLKIQSHPEVIFHPSANYRSASLCPTSPTSSNTVSLLLTAIAALICGIAIGLLCFYLKNQCNERRESEDQRDLVKYQIGLDDFSVS